ncbi:unnamed protein product [Adineta steineri]|uniref:Uncharacterized protein n=1 Tax=Adineta steineri TaxID=433720 RepID=A0A814AH08_9BILA|nr:unnamed protein product [Adineta steineri]
MHLFQQQPYAGFAPQQPYAGLGQNCAQCVLTPGLNNYFPGYSQPQQQYSQYGAYGNPYQQQQFYYPQQQQQQQYPFYPQQAQAQFYPQQAQAQFYPQQQTPFCFPLQQQQQQQYPFYPQQQGNLGQNAYGFQQYSPQQQYRVFEGPASPVHHKKEKAKGIY